VVARREIVDTVWATEFIADNTLTHAIAELRAALGDDSRNPSYIETIYCRGYLLAAPVGDPDPEVPRKRGKWVSGTAPDIPGSSDPTDWKT